MVLLANEAFHGLYRKRRRRQLERAGRCASAMRKRMGEKGLIKSQQYGIEKIAMQWKTLFDDLMQNHEV